MKLRIIVLTNDLGPASQVSGAKVETIYSTFDVEASPEFQAFWNRRWGYSSRSIVGVEVLPAEPASQEAPRD